MLLVGINYGTDQGVTHDIPFSKITHGDAGHGFEGLQASTRPERLFAGNQFA